MKQQKIADPNKTIQSVYVRVKNNEPGSPIQLRKWTTLRQTEKPRSYQRTGKDTGVI